VFKSIAGGLWEKKVRLNFLSFPALPFACGLRRSSEVTTRSFEALLRRFSR